MSDRRPIPDPQDGFDTRECLQLVVGVGASAGGLAAFKELLAATPSDAGLSLILVQHLDPDHESLLPELLARVTEMRVVEADDGALVEPNVVYLIPPGKFLGIENGRLVLSPPQLHGGVRLPVDHLFRSLARAFGERAVGVVLSGTGNDGTAGMREIKANRGLVIAQTVTTAAQAGMPQSVVSAGLADLVLDISEIPEALARFRRIGVQPYSIDTRPEEIFDQLAAILSPRLDLDIRAYKTSTVLRRVYRRMTLEGFETFGAYLEDLRSNAVEQRRLGSDLLIGVTEFFRDGAAFEELARSVIAPMVEAAEPGSALRAWIPACATGQEAYSIAIAFMEAIDASSKPLGLQMFATDVDPEAIHVARAAVYADGAVGGLEEQRLKRWFTPLPGQGYQVTPRLRDSISFATHDLVRDAPFSRMDLVSCRNVLIYLQREAQSHVRHSLHFALREGGVLFLGSSESPGLPGLSTISDKWRLYRKTEPTGLPPVRGHAWRRTVSVAGTTTREAGLPASELALQSMIACRVPPTVVVAEDGTILLAHGDLHPYLQLPQGQPTLKLWSFVAPDLLTRLRTAVSQARQSSETVLAEARLDSREGRVRILVSPAEGIEGAVVVSFETLADTTPREDLPESTTGEGAVSQLELELELAATREDLRNTVAALEGAHYNLDSASAESRSMTEELQTSNEELEASAEELRSLNEELSTLNAQLRDKVDLLEESRHDISNFFASTKVATLFFDDALRLRRLTPSAAELTGLDFADVGRTIESSRFASDALSTDLDVIARAVISDLTPRETEIARESGRWYLRRVLPYLTESRQIAGIVVTFHDISQLKAAAQDLTTQVKRQELVAGLAIHALEDDNLIGFLDRCALEIQSELECDFTQIFELQAGDEQLLLRSGSGWPEGVVGEACVDARFNSQAGYTLKAHGPVVVTDLPSETRFSGPSLLSEFGVTSGVSVVIAEGLRPYGVLAAHSVNRRDFTHDEVHFLVTVAALITSAVLRHRTRIQLRLESRLAVPLATASSRSDVVEAVLSACADALGTVVGEYWQLVDGKLVCSRTRVERGFDERLVAERGFSDRTFVPGEGLVGRVHREARAIWIGRLVETDIFQRSEPAAGLNLTTGLGFPVRSGDGIDGVITIFAQEPLVLEHPLLSSLEAVGRLAGLCIDKLDTQTIAKDQETRSAATLDACRDGVVTIDAEGRIIGFNQAAEEMFHQRREDVLGSDMADCIIPQAEQHAHRTAFAEHLRSGRARIFGKRLLLQARRRDGTEFPAEVTITRVEGQSAPTFTAYIRDVSIRLATEQALASSEERYREIFEYAGVSLWEQDFAGVYRAFDELRASGVRDVAAYCRENVDFVERCAELVRVLDVNQESVWLFDARSKDELKGSLSTVFGPETLPVFTEELAALASGERTFSSELPARSLAGRPLYLTFNVRVAPPEDDGIVRAMVSIMDISRRKQAEMQLQNADRQKDVFMAMLGHELRNPLTAIRSASFILSADDFDASQQRVACDIIERQSEQMRMLVDGLLDMTRIVSGKINIERSRVDLCSVVRNVLTDCEGQIAECEVRVDAQIGAEPIWCAFTKS